MSANKRAKELGLKDLVEVSEITKRNNRNTLHNWYSTNPHLFNAVLLGCVKFKKLKEQGISNDIFKNTTASKQIKYAGLKNLEEVCFLVKKSRGTVYSWYLRYPEFFKIVVLGCVEIKKEFN